MKSPTDRTKIPTVPVIANLAFVIPLLALWFLLQSHRIASAAPSNKVTMEFMAHGPVPSAQTFGILPSHPVTPSVRTGMQSAIRAIWGGGDGGQLGLCDNFEHVEGGAHWDFTPSFTLLDPYGQSTYAAGAANSYYVAAKLCGEPRFGTVHYRLIDPDGHVLVDKTVEEAELYIPPDTIDENAMPHLYATITEFAYRLNEYSLDGKEALPGIYQLHVKAGESEFGREFQIEAYTGPRLLLLDPVDDTPVKKAGSGSEVSAVLSGFPATSTIELGLYHLQGTDMALLDRLELQVPPSGNLQYRVRLPHELPDADYNGGVFAIARCMDYCPLEMIHGHFEDNREVVSYAFGLFDPVATVQDYYSKLRMAIQSAVHRSGGPGGPGGPSNLDESGIVNDQALQWFEEPYAMLTSDYQSRLPLSWLVSQMESVIDIEVDSLEVLEADDGALTEKVQAVVTIEEQDWYATYEVVWEMLLVDGTWQLHDSTTTLLSVRSKGLGSAAEISQRAEGYYRFGV